MTLIVAVVIEIRVAVVIVVLLKTIIVTLRAIIIYIINLKSHGSSNSESHSRPDSINDDKHNGCSRLGCGGTELGVVLVRT